MYTKTMFAAAAVIAQAAAYSNATLPACWSSCFAKYQIDSEDCLCSDSISSVVATCIDSGCSAASSKSYEGWLSSYCSKGAASSSSAAPVTVTVDTTSYTTICPVTETQTSSSSTWTSVYSTTSTILSTYSKTVPVTSASPTTYSTIVKTSTIINTSSGSPVTSTVTSTKTPGWNTWTSSAPVWGTASAPAPSGTGVWGPKSPVPYTGAAVHVKAAGALVGAGAFVALLL